MEPPTGNPTFGAYTNELQATRDAIAGFVATETGTLPDFGSTQYTGVMRANLDEENGTGTDAAVGFMAITALWEDNAITGSVTDIVDGDDGAYSGDLTLSNGTIADRVTADVDGVIVNAAGETLTVDGFIRGDFFSDIIYIQGSVDGTVTGPDGFTQIGGDWAVSDR